MWKTTGKVQFFVFQDFFASIEKIFILGERLSFDILLLFSNFLSLSATREAILKCFYKNINILLKKKDTSVYYTSSHSLL